MGRPPQLQVRRFWGSDDTDCTILHVDMDAFFAACETIRHPELKGKPIVIGTGNRSVVSTANYEARSYGIHSAQPVAEARRLCPDAIFLPVDHSYYRKISNEIFNSLHSITDNMEQVSIDEAYLDVSNTLLLWENPTAIARWIRHTVASTFGITCSVGIASNILMAKLASSTAKPDDLLLIPKDKRSEFIRLLPLTSIPGIGAGLKKRFSRWGISTVKQLSELSYEEIVHITNSPAISHTLFEAAQGNSSRTVNPSQPEKSISTERTFSQDCIDLHVLNIYLQHYSDELASQLRKRNLTAKTISVKIRYPDFTYRTRSQTIEPTDSAIVILKASQHLLEILLDLRPGTPVRLLGSGVSNLIPRYKTAIQPLLLSDNMSPSKSSPVSSEPLHDTINHIDTHSSSQPISPSLTHKIRQVENALDAIRKKFGDRSASLGTYTLEISTKTSSASQNSSHVINVEDKNIASDSISNNNTYNRETK